jgi:hypothetical protein
MAVKPKGSAETGQKGAKKNDGPRKTNSVRNFGVQELLQELRTCDIPIFARTTCGTNRAEGQITPFRPPGKVLYRFRDIIRHPLKHECEGIECRNTIHDGVWTMKIETISVAIAQEKIASKPEGIRVVELIRKAISVDILDESVEVQTFSTLHNTKCIVQPT